MAATATSEWRSFVRDSSPEAADSAKAIAPGFLHPPRFKLIAEPFGMAGY